MDARKQYDALNNALGDMKKQNGADDLSDYDNQEFVPPDNIPFNTKGSESFDYSKVSENAEIQSGTFSAEDFRSEPPNTANTPPIGHTTPHTFEEPPKIDDSDEYLFPGGPLKSDLESWRAQYGSIWFVDDLPDENVYIYRNLNRYEYKSIMATPNTDPLMREEMICEQCLLYPNEYSYSSMANADAGVPTLLAQHIMETSGFSKASVPKRL